ncbi:hypothetical protein DFH06DRAFT_1140605 [Mycena polygramma]|nr:hypothetical protein DFH06DRAFT_1140605 [Mycena polygramma]
MVAISGYVEGAQAVNEQHPFWNLDCWDFVTVCNRARDNTGSDKFGLRFGRGQLRKEKKEGRKDYSRMSSHARTSGPGELGPTGIIYGSGRARWVHVCGGSTGSGNVDDEPRKDKWAGGGATTATIKARPDCPTPTSTSKLRTIFSFLESPFATPGSNSNDEAMSARDHIHIHGDMNLHQRPVETDTSTLRQIRFHNEDRQDTIRAAAASRPQLAEPQTAKRSWHAAGMDAYEARPPQRKESKDVKDGKGKTSFPRYVRLLLKVKKMRNTPRSNEFWCSRSSCQNLSGKFPSGPEDADPMGKSLDRFWYQLRLDQNSTDLGVKEHRKDTEKWQLKWLQKYNSWGNPAGIGLKTAYIGT